MWLISKLRHRVNWSMFELASQMYLIQRVERLSRRRGR